IVFLGFGSDLSERIVENEELLGPFPEVNSDYIYKVTGVRRRHWASESERPSDLAERAARRAIADAGIELAQIDAVIVATVTPEVAMPSTACILASKLGLSGIPAFDLNAACSGWLYSVGVARGLVNSGAARCVLTVGVDLQSRLLDRNDRSTVFLFGDGAGAAIVAAESFSERAANAPRLRWLCMACEPQGVTWARRMFPGDRIPGLEHGTQNVDPWIRMEGTEIFRIASRAMTDSIRMALESTGWRAEELTRVIPHQANARILRVIERHVALRPGVLYVGLEDTGNVAGGSIPVSLCGLKDELRRGDKLVFCAAGAGITVAAAAVEW
ncbi:MAG: ketoacyl-ACP synthase III, partial [Planctomycetia bacterium]|nr:ketoacyl-ACP synthase III [Planctomycetia bacterium]